MVIAKSLTDDIQAKYRCGVYPVPLSPLFLELVRCYGRYRYYLLVISIAGHFSQTAAGPFPRASISFLSRIPRSASRI